MSIREIKEDWDNVKRRHEAWWEREIHDRVMLFVWAPRNNPDPTVPLQPDSVEQPWLDAELMVRRTLNGIATAFQGGDALPLFWHNWSAGNAVLFGCKPHFAEHTVWVDPVESGGGCPVLRFDRESPWWKWMRDSTLTAARASEGRYWIFPAWGNNAGDTLGLVRGTEALMMDIMDDPEWVRDAVKATSDILLEVCEELWPLTELAGVEGYVNYVGLWSPRRTIGVDFDLACMVSTKVYERLFLPPLLEHARRVDRVVYHLDGVLQFRHLDMLLQLPEIHGYQFAPGEGRMEVAQWIPLIRRIQSKGKSIVVYARPDEIEMLMDAVDHEGLCIGTGCKTEDEARELIRFVERKTRASHAAKR